jgi:hypothetical protein
MASLDECVACLVKFEKTFHDDIFTWVNHKLEQANKKAQDCDVLEISTDDCLFSKLFAEKFKVKKLVTVARGNQELKVEGVEVLRVAGLANNQLDELKALGKFDAILLKECTHEVEELTTFLDAVRSMLKDDDGRVFLICHPKNPPVPLPDPAIPFWRKLAPNREEIINAAKQLEMGQSCYSASCPIKVQKLDWGNIIKCRYFPAVKKAEKCTDKEIREFINSKPSRFIEFEEKLLMFLFTPKPIPGMSEEEEAPAPAAAPPAESQPQAQEEAPKTE